MNLYPYKIQFVQSLKPKDLPACLYFAENMLQHKIAGHNLWMPTDATFYLSRYTNK